MGKRSTTGIPALSFFWKRALGISTAKGRLPQSIGIPLTRFGRQRKVGRAVGYTVFLALPLIYAVIGAPSVLSQTAAEPVPAKWLHDGKLVAGDFNFSVETPAPDSRWTYARLPDIQGSKATAFLVDVSADTRFVVMVWDKAGAMNANATKNFVDGMQKSMPKAWRIDDAKIEPSAFPLKDSSRVRITVHLPNDSILYAYGYIVTGTRSYFLLDYSAENSEPSQFNRFVGSFAFLKPPRASSDFAFYAFLAGIIVVCQVIPIWVSVKAKPLAEKPYRWGTYVGIITGLVGSSFLPVAFSATDVYGKAASAVVGLCAILCSIGILWRRKFGVVTFVITYLTIMMASPFLVAVRNHPVTSQQQGQALPALVFLVMTTVYFKKRWRLMGTPKTMTPTPVPASNSA